MKKKDSKNVLERIRASICETVRLWHVVVVVLSVLYFVPMRWSPFSFHFMHANVFHLLVNLMAVQVVVRSPRRLVNGFAVATLLVLFSSSQVVGFSAVLFFIWGSHFLEQLKLGSNRRRLITNLVVVFVLSLLIPSMAFYMHFAPFVCGVVYTLVYDWSRRIANDVNEASF